MDKLYRFRDRLPATGEGKAPHAEVQVTTEGATSSLWLYDVIDSWGGYWGISASEVAAALADIPADVDTIQLHINSPGGEVYEAIAIKNLLTQHKARVVAVVDGLAASAASLIAVAADEVVMGANTTMMIHDAWMGAQGNAEQFRGYADDLDKVSDNAASIYAQRTGGTTAEWRAAMLEEHWYSAEEAVELGLADRVGLIDEEAPSTSAAAERRLKVALAVVRGMAEAPAAFDQARASKVAASTQKESDMDKDQVAALVTETVKTELAAVPPREATVSDDDLKAGLARLGFGAVKEELPYRFDAIGGQHNFLQDILHGNGEDKARVDAFIAQVFNVATTDVDDVNPSPTRPDLFVDGVLPSAPIFAAFDKGAIADATPFIVPKFNTATGLVATHTEGTEPTEGTFTTTSQTVTPKAKSGKVEINREVLDAVGNPAVQGLVWAKMLAAFGTELETEAAATVNAASLTELGTVITAAEADAYDVADLTEANLLSAVFIDGSESWDVFLGHRDLFSKLALAPKSSTDLAKRYPMLSPSNANGTVAERYRRLNVGGYDMVPAGALGATNTNGKSIIGSSSAVACWASTPKRIEWEQVAFGTLGLFGYYAGAVIDLARVRKITYNESTSS